MESNSFSLFRTLIWSENMLKGQEKLLVLIKSNYLYQEIRTRDPAVSLIVSSPQPVQPHHRIVKQDFIVIISYTVCRVH